MMYDVTQNGLWLNIFADVLYKKNIQKIKNTWNVKMC